MIVGVDIWWGTSRSTFLNRDLPLMKECGLQMIRLNFGELAYMDNLRTLVPTIVGNGIGVLGLLMRTDLSPDNVGAWGDWVYGVVSEFKDYVHVWELWNEPNLTKFFTGADPVKYTNFMKRGYTEAKRADPTCFCIGASICQTKQSGLDFFTAIYENGGKDYMDAVAYHPYCNPYSPERTDVATAYTKLETHVRPIMERYGDGDKKLWLTEIGWSVTDVGEQNQANYHQKALTMALNWGFVEQYTVYNWTKDKGLTDSAVNPRPSFYSVRDWITGAPPPPAKGYLRVHAHT